MSIRVIVLDERWIAQALEGDYQVDLLFSSPNCLITVDNIWFNNALTTKMYGQTVKIVPKEELIWCKAFVQDQTRFDGADINHIILISGKDLNWQRLLMRMENYWEVLLPIIINFRFIYPSQRDLVPSWLIKELLDRVHYQLENPTPQDKICRGPLLSRTQYKVDITKLGADILVLCDDLTNAGLANEAEVLAEELNSLKIPAVGVLGNHDFTNNEEGQIRKILSDKVFILDGQPFAFENVGFAGVKSFGGGFDNHMVTPLGEDLFKQFVYDAVYESIKLEESLKSLETEKKVVILHYAPIRQTAVFHGHAHHGTARGKTPSGVPVYNVSLPVLLHTPPHKSYLVMEI